MARLNAADSSSEELLQRIVVDPRIFGGKPIVRGERMAVEHILSLLAAGDTEESILEAYEWLEPEDIRACLLYAVVSLRNERFEPTFVDSSQ